MKENLMIPSLHACYKYKKQVKKLQFQFKKTNQTIVPTDSFMNTYIRKVMKEFSDPRRVSIEIFFPLWFQENYNLNKKITEKLSLAGIYYSEFIKIQDYLIDIGNNKDKESNNSFQILGNIFQMKAIELLLTIFPSHSKFWNYYQRYMMEYWKVIFWEIQFNNQIRTWSCNDVKKLGKKLSPLKCIATGLAILADKQEQIRDLENMIEKFHVGIQMLDDIDDWKNDLNKNHYSYFLSKWLLNISEDSKIPKNMFKKTPKTILPHIINLSLKYLQSSNKIAKKLKLKSFQDFFSILIYEIKIVRVMCTTNPELVLKKGPSNLLISRKEAKIDSFLNIIKEKYIPSLKEKNLMSAIL